ncbi:DUF167 domain-containing protein [Lignipirellula cremea]|uniref:UPF0235 protein Pla8534_29200 n=1 Tax=Lignipirellula cremea TaxID=2528010 RepID=A0A518DTI5_9BACT|nr:DUF167 domain-containing protein [Lignipirellula cremea]QDU95108.1 hypothetical protein Pla8534_29200 [Lignipirellula cremea]
MISIHLQPHAEGVLLPVKAAPGSRRNEIRGEQDGALKVAVTQIAEKGKANQALVQVLAKTLRLRKSQIELQSGMLNSHKQFLIREISLAQLQAKIDAACPG